VLKHRAYLDGTRYYPLPEAFLYFLGRFVRLADDKSVRKTFLPLLKERLQELVGSPGDALALALRIVACAYVGIRDEIDLRRLLTLQNEDGSWGPGDAYRYGTTGIRIGNYGLATALALHGIQLIKENE
jgi:hypothetical protein